MLAATIALTPASAIEQARYLVLFAAGDQGQAQFRGMHLRRVGPDMVFCGKVNTRMPDGSLTGWQDVMVVVSGNPNGRAVVTGVLPYQTEIIKESCRHGDPVDGRDYSAALTPFN
jgi:hypothetical protein